MTTRQEDVLYDPQNDIVLIDKVRAPGDNVQVKFAAGLQGAAQLIGPSLTVLNTHTLDSAPWSLALQPGFYKIALGEKSQFFEVPAQKGMVNVQFG